MLEEIIQRNLSRIALGLEEIPGIISIDFMDIFPVSEDHRSQLDAEVARRARALQNTERGNVYELDEPIQTQYGELKFIKIRFFDETRLNWEAAADFKIKDRQLLLNKIGKDDRFSYIERPDWNAVEFKTDDTLVYFLEPLASEVYAK